MKRPSAHVAAAVALASLITFLIGWKLAPEASSVRAGEDAGEMRERRRERPSRGDGSVSLKMDRIRNAASPVERSRAAISLAMSLDPSEFAAWVEGERFSSRSGPELSIFRMILFERWIAEDPDGLIVWGVKNDYGQAGRGLDHIAKHDPERLIAHFREHPNEAAELRQLKDIAKDHPSLALVRLKELGEAGLSPRSDQASRELLLAVSEGSTAELEGALAAMPPGLRKQAESVVFGRKLERDFDGEIGKLMEHPDGMRIFQENLGLLKGKAGAILAAVAEMPDSWRSGIASDPWEFFQNGETKAWMEADLEALGFSVRQSEEIRRRGLHSLTHEDPAFVLNHLGGGEMDRQLLEYAISSLAGRSAGDEEAMERMLAGITSPEIREAAREQWETARLLKAADGNAADWLRNLGGLESSQSLVSGVASRLRDLDGTQLAEYRESFDGLSGDVKTNAAIAIAKSASSYAEASEIHGDAILHLARNPPAIQPEANGRKAFEISEAASGHTVRLATNDPVAAAGWVASLPEGSARKWAAKNLATHWNQYDPDAAAGWMKTLPAGERKLVESHLETGR